MNVCRYGSGLAHEYYVNPDVCHYDNAHRNLMLFTAATGPTSSALQTLELDDIHSIILSDKSKKKQESHLKIHYYYFIFLSPHTQFRVSRPYVCTAAFMHHITGGES